MKIKKSFILTVLTTYIISLIPFSASANMLGDNENYDYDAVCSYKIINNEAIITDVSTSGKYFDIPDIIEYDSSTGHHAAPVVGVENYAFALCENLEVIYIPETFKISKTGNVAFLTSSAVMNFMDNELGSAATTDDIIKYIAKTALYKNGDYTDEDLAELSIKLNNKISMIDLSGSDTIEGKVMTIIKNIDKMNLSDELQNKFDLWVSTITYNGLTLSGNENADEIKQYAKGRGFLNMKYSPITYNNYVLGDANNDGKVNVRDAAFIASSIAKGIQISPIENPAADYNLDGKVNVRDAAAIASSLSGKK